MTKDAHSLNATARADHERRFGKFNDFPPNWRPIDEGEFWKKFMTYSADVEDYRQMLRPEEVLARMPANRYGQVTVASARLYFYHDGTGLALVATDHGERPRFYQFAVCDHDYEGVPEKSYMHYHVSRCKKCGFECGVDSSG